MSLRPESCLNPLHNGSAVLSTIMSEKTVLSSLNPLHNGSAVLSGEPDKDAVRHRLNPLHNGSAVLRVWKSASVLSRS